MSQEQLTNNKRIKELENERRDLECRYSIMPASAQDKADERLNQISDLLKELRSTTC